MLQGPPKTILALTLGLVGLTALFFYLTMGLINKEKQAVREAGEKIDYLLSDEIKKFEFGLQGARGAFAVTENELNFSHFKHYARSRNNFDNFKGSLGFGFIRYFPRKSLQYELRLKSTRGVTIHPQMLEQHNMVIEMIEPEAQNRAALGFNVGTEERRKNAAWESALTGNAKFSKPIRLVQVKDSHVGFLYFLPVYKTIIAPGDEKKRIENLQGWIYTPVRLDVVVKEVVKKMPAEVSVQVTVDGQSMSDSSVKKNNRSFLYDNSYDLIASSSPDWLITVVSSSASAHRQIVGLAVIYILLTIALFVSAYLFRKSLEASGKSLQLKSLWLDGVVQAAEYSIVATDPDGLIITFNSGAEKMLGYSKDEIINRETPKIIHEESEVVARAAALTQELGFPVSPGFDSFIAKARIAGSDTNEWTYVKKNGDRLRVRLCVTCIRGSDNEVIGYLGIAEDLTEQKKLQNELEDQRMRLISAAKMSVLGDMAAGIAHEINTPLAVIHAKSLRLREKILSEQIAKDQSINELEKIEQTAMRISKIVAGLRLFSRNSNRDNLEQTSLSKVIEAAMDMCSEKLKFVGLQIEVKISEDFVVDVRPGELAQVLLNLISNSMDAIKDLNEKWIHIYVYSSSDKVCVSVKDSGHGIDALVVEKMMNPFYTTKPVGQGTGLGLSISKGIIESFSGRLSYSHSSKNTEFIIELPRQKTSNNRN